MFEDLFEKIDDVIFRPFEGIEGKQPEEVYPNEWNTGLEPWSTGQETWSTGRRQSDQWRTF
jgi:hypothetical protein